MGQYWWIIIIAAVAAMIFYVAVFRRRKKSENTSQEAYVSGLRSIISGDNQTAFVKLRQAVDLDTENVDAYLKLGDLFREKEMIDRALQIHKELTLRRDIPSELSSDISKSLALDYLEAGMKENAIDLLKPMIRDDRMRGWAEEKLLNLFITVKLWKEAEELYASILKRKKLKESRTMACMTGPNIIRPVSLTKMPCLSIKTILSPIFISPRAIVRRTGLTTRWSI
jgi:lipopolysaccharide biosynthesis regulator YciM